MVAPKRYDPIPFQTELFGGKVFANVVKDLDTRSPWVSQWVLNLLSSVLIRERKGEGHVKMLTEIGVILARSY